METEFANKRYYQLQLKPTCQLKCSYCPGLGLISEGKKIHQDLVQSLNKARSGNYSAVLIPCNALDMPDLPIVIETIKGFKLDPIVQINSRQLQTQKDRVNEILEMEVGVQVIWGNNISVPDSLLSQILEKATSFHITIVAHKRMHALETFRSLPDSMKPKTYFYFPYQQETSDEFFTVENIYEFLKRFRVQFSGYKALPSPGIDIFDQRKKNWQEFEPNIRPMYSTPACDVPERTLDYSVIISTFNNEHVIEDVLRTLSQQSMPLQKFEVILVDEGSTDRTISKAIDFGKTISSDFQVRVIRMPRFSVPTNERAEHKTAVSMNLGVKVSKGEHVLFLDVHSLIPQSTLSGLLEDHKDWDLVQTKRLVLPADVDEIEVKVLDPQSLSAYAEPENPFWSQFYKNSENWNQMTDGWRYISSKNLSVRRDVFEFIGWYRKTFLYYGFEDSDLGYRAKRKGFNFYLSSAAVFQSSTSLEVSSLLKRGTDKQESLSKMAKVFFQNNLDTDIYENLRSYM